MEATLERILCCVCSLAVAAKAPRKQVASVRSVCSPVSSKSKLSRRGGGGNVIKPWPTPTWQKGRLEFVFRELLP